MGVVLDKTQKKALENMSAAQRASYIADILRKRVGGMNEALAQTDRGAKIQWANNWSDRLEDIGKRIIPIEGGLYRLLNKLSPQITAFIDEFFDSLEWGISKMQPVTAALKELFTYLSQHLTLIFKDQAPIIKSFFENVFVPGLTLAIKSLTEFFKILDTTYNFIKSNWIPILSVLAGVSLVK